MSENENQTELSLADALEALKGARQQAASYRTKFSNAQNELGRLASALRAAGLDPDSDDLDTRAAAHKTAGSSQEETEQLKNTVDYLRVLLDAYEDATGVSLGETLEALPESATDEQWEAAMTTAFQPLTALQDRARRADLQDAATALGKPVDALADYLEGKPWGAQTVKGQDGTEAQVWGIGSGDAFKPLADLPGVQAIGAVTPQPKPTLPTTTKGNPPAAPSRVTVAEIAAQKAQDPNYSM